MKYTRDEMDTDSREAMIGELAALYDVAGPLPALSEEELRRMRRRVRKSIIVERPLWRTFRLGTVLAGLALLLLGSIGYAAVDRLGWTRYFWKGEKASEPAPVEVIERKVKGRKTARNVALPTILLEEPPMIPDPVVSPVPDLKVLPPAAPEGSRAIIKEEEVLRKRGRGSWSPPPVQGSVALDLKANPLPSPTVVPAPIVAPVPEIPEVKAPEPEGSNPDPTAPSTEPALLRVAMQRLRTENDPAGALVLLRDLSQRFPRGSLVGERSILEVEALLGLKREVEALALLDGMNISELPRSGERFVLRGELRALVRRFSEATLDFDRALARVSGLPAWHERALWGRAVARLQNGERQAGIADLEDYREQYPKGRHAAEAARLLTQQ